MTRATCVLCLSVALLLLFGVPSSYAVTVTPLTTSSGQDSQPNWSHDGTRIVFLSERSGQYGMWIMPASGGTPNLLIPSSGSGVWGHFGEQEPEWSPDDNTIVFQSTAHSYWDIYKIPTSGGSPIRLTYMTDCVGPSYSPDGSTIVFRHLSGGYHLWTVPASGGTPVKLTSGSSEETFPEYSPDGSKIVFQYLPGIAGSRDVYVIPAPGGSLTPLATDPSDDGVNPSWSPDGKYIAFSSDRGGNRNIWVMDSRGETYGLWQITKHPTADEWPSWSPDGQKIVFHSDRSGNRDLWIASDLPMETAPGPWLKIIDIMVDGTPYVGEETQMIIVVRNTGDQSVSDCPGIKFFLIVNEVDICGYMTPDSYLCSEGFLEDVNKSVQEYEITNYLKNIDPGEEVWIPIQVTFTNFSGYTDAVKVAIFDNHACLIRYEDNGIKYLKPFETQPHPNSYVNCFSTILSAASSGIINTKAFKDAVKTVQALSHLDEARQNTESMMEEISKGNYGKAAEHAFDAFWPVIVIAGYAIPGNPLSFIDIAMYEFNAQGCAGLIANWKLFQIRFFTELLKKLELHDELLGGFIGFIVGCPTEIVVQDELGNITSIDSGGIIENNIDSSMTYYLQDIRAVLVPGTGMYSVTIRCLEAGVFNFIIVQPGSDSTQQVIHFEKLQCDQACRAHLTDFGVSTSDLWLWLDTDDDGTVDRHLRPTLIERLQENGTVGKISGWVELGTQGLLGVAMGLEDSLGQFIVTTATDTEGAFAFDSIEPGEYNVYAVAPLGFVLEEESRTISVDIDYEDILYFRAELLSHGSSQKSIGYWKHQVNVHLSGKGHAQESLADMSGYMSVTGEHFNDNLANPVTIFQVAQPATQTDSFEVLKDLLTVQGKATMNDRAKQQLIALMLNVVSLKLHQSTPISEDSATVSQAITHCNQLITDSDSTNDETAKDIADQINNGILIASGAIPLSTPNISYKGAKGELTKTPNPPNAFSLSQNYPNPFNPVTEIKYSLPKDCHLILAIYNILGQKVRDLVNEHQTAGFKIVQWNGRNDKGSEVSTGIYLYKLRASEFTQTKKMLFLK